MVDYLKSIRAADQARVYGLFEGPGNPCGNAAYEGRKYKQAVDATGGTWGSICANNYTTTLQNISANVSRIVKREFKLDHAPDAGTLMAAIDGTPITTGFTLNGDTVTLDSVQPTQVELTISYVYGATPKFSRFKLSNGADPATLDVRINNVSVNAGDYTYDATAKEVIFDLQPINDANIMVKYRRDDVLPVRFPLGTTDILDKPKKVTVNGQEVQTFAYDDQAIAIEFATAPTAVRVAA
jgi:hypothetical protein